MKRVPKTRVNVSEQKQKNRSTIYSSFDATNQRISTIFSRLVITVVVVVKADVKQFIGFIRVGSVKVEVEVDRSFTNVVSTF